MIHELLKEQFANTNYYASIAIIYNPMRDEFGIDLEIQNDKNKLVNKTAIVLLRNRKDLGDYTDPNTKSVVIDYVAINRNIEEACKNLISEAKMRLCIS